MPPGPTSPVQGSDQDRGVDTHSSKSRHAPGLTSPGQGSDQDGGVDTHSSESRHASGPTGSDASCQTRMEEWTPTLLSPKMPPGPTSPVQGSDQDGGVNTHSSESRDFPWSYQSCAGVRPGWMSEHPLI